MAGYENGNWHQANGRTLSIRPPTVDEALPYSPFTSVVPFSPDIIPFPITEPPTPPTTLSAEQQSAAKRATAILNDEIKGQSSTAQHLESTLRELRNLLGDPRDMSEFRFKPTTQLATPPPDSPNGQLNGTSPTKIPSLSPFASMLLKRTDVHYLPAAGIQSPQQSKAIQKPSQQTIVQAHAQPRTPSQPVASRVNQTSQISNGTLQYQPNTPASSSSSQPRSGPVVMIKPLGPDARREDYQRYDHLAASDGQPQRRQQDVDKEIGLSALRPQDREIAELKISQLQTLVDKVYEEKDDPDESQYFSKVSCQDTDLTVMETDTLDRLYNRVMAVCTQSCFSSVPVQTILRIHTLSEPLIAASDQSSLCSEGDFESWEDDLKIAESALKACKLALTTIVEGREDRRTHPEDLIIMIMQAIKRVLDACVFPVLLARRSGESSELFTYASTRKDQMRAVLISCTSVMRHVAMLIGKIPLTETSLNHAEALALALLFQQNSESEKDSVFGIRMFETLRQVAMDVLIRIFATRPDQQQFIISEILNNLERLPDKGANARQFKSQRDSPIMSVSALFMRFVQVAATDHRDNHEKVAPKAGQDDSSEDEESDYDSERSPAKKKTTKGSKKTAGTIAQELLINAQGRASSIASVLTERAMNLSKSADKPFRNLLDMFVEDFCSVLGSPEWPAATILLYQLLRCMFHIFNTTSSKDMALAIMGTMGCGIIDFKLRLKHLKRDLDASLSELSAQLDRLAEDALCNNIRKQDFVAVKGPYRVVIESLPDYLKVQSNEDDPHLRSLRGCYVTFWLDSITQAIGPKDNDAPPDHSLLELQGRVEAMVADSNSLSRDYKFQSVSETQTKLAAGTITLQREFCQYFSAIVNTMLKTTKESGANQKTRAMKNIEAFLNRDSQAIPEQLVMGVISLLRDNSPSVRTEAVALVEKLLEGNPALERQCLQSVLGLTTDSSVATKQKAIKFLKKIYLISASNEHKLMIVGSLLLPSQDHEEKIAEKARQSLEEFWLKAPATEARLDENHVKLNRIERASLLVQTVRLKKHLPDLEAVEKFFKSSLAAKNPSAATHFRACRDLVADMVEGVISPESMATNCSQEDILQTLSILARVSPRLVTVDQLTLLKLYIKDPSTTADLAIFRPTVTIFRHVLPHLSNLQVDFANDVRQLLSIVVPKLASWAARGNAACKATLLDVVHCLWIISPLADKGIERSIATIASTLLQLQPFSSCSKEAAVQAKAKIKSYLILVGTFGKVCDFDKHADSFRTTVSRLVQRQMQSSKNAAEGQTKNLIASANKQPSVLLLEAVRPFTKQPWDLDVREHALCSVGEVCQGTPALFTRADVDQTFKLVFTNDIVSLKQIVLDQFHDFLVKAERRSESDGTDGDRGDASKPLGITFQAGDGQVSTNHIARSFLQNIIEIALKNDNDVALLATKVITSISRQGLVHPKECGAALIALGTSRNPQIAQEAATEHAKIHSSHESMFEKEYMAAVRMAFDYQQEVYKDAHGMDATAYKPKMLQAFVVLKSGTRKTLKQFIDNLCKRIDFELPNLEDPDTASTTILFVRFCLENLALFEVPRLEDVAILLNALENIVLRNTGPSVGVAIETEMPRKPIAEFQPPQQFEGAMIDISVDQPVPIPAVQDDKEPISDARLLQITQACVILQMMWETRNFVRKYYNLHNLTGRIPKNDFQKPAARNNLVSGRELWDRLEDVYNSLESRETMMKRCYDFAELLEIDKETQIAEDDMEGEEGAGYATPDEDPEDGSAVPNSGRGRKRKSSAPIGNTPKKARGRLMGNKGKKRNSKTPELDGWD